MELAADPRDAAQDMIAQHADDPQWLDAFAQALDERRSGAELHRLVRVWDMSYAETGKAMGVSRQAVTKWADRGVPPDRRRPVADWSAATDLLVQHLRRDRIPAVVRRPAAGLGGRSLYDLLMAGETPRMLQACREMFAFGDAHG